MREMKHSEAMAFLTTGTRTGKLATVRADGRPHLAPIWFVLDGDALVFTTWHTSQKVKNMMRDNRVSLVVDLEEPPYAYVAVEGTVTTSRDLGAVRRFAELIAERYMGSNRAEEHGARNGVEGELLVRINVDRVIAFTDMSG